MVCFFNARASGRSVLRRGSGRGKGGEKHPDSWRRKKKKQRASSVGWRGVRAELCRALEVSSGAAVFQHHFMYVYLEVSLIEFSEIYSQESSA